MVIKEAEVALVQQNEVTFNLPALIDPQGVARVMQENLEGTNPGLTRVKIPSGGGLAFEVPGEDDKPEVVKEIVGVVLDHHAANAFWEDKFSGQNNPPDCSALDGKMGVGAPGGNCALCPNNQWGSDPAGGKGKWCKNIHRLYILPEGEVFPLILALPPTSLRNFTQYMSRLASKVKPFYSVVTTIKLQKAQNANGITYSQTVFSKAADLNVQEVIAIKKYADTLKPTMRGVAIEATDYNTEETENGNTAAQAAGDEPF